MQFIRIIVRGGIAYVSDKTSGVVLEIVDWDNAKDSEDKKPTVDVYDKHTIISNGEEIT